MYLINPIDFKHGKQTWEQVVNLEYICIWWVCCGWVHLCNYLHSSELICWMKRAHFFSFIYHTIVAIGFLVHHLIFCFSFTFYFIFCFTFHLHEYKNCNQIHSIYWEEKNMTSMFSIKRYTPNSTKQKYKSFSIYTILSDVF